MESFDNAGSTILELLLASVILLILYGSALSVTRHGAQAYLKLHQHALQAQKLERISAYILNNAEHAQAYPGLSLFIPEHISKTSAPHLRNRAFTPTHAPKPECSTISSAQLHPNTIIHLGKRQRSGKKTIHVLACLEGSEESPGEFFLALGIDGYTPVHGKFRKKGRCANGTTLSGALSLLENTPFTKLSFSGTAADLLYHSRILIPLQDAAALYVAKDNSLRRLSLIRLENQPLAYGIRCLTHETIAAKNGYSLFKYHIHLSDKGDSISKHSSILPLRRLNANHLNYVF